MNVFDLMAKISLDTSEYEGGLSGASKKSNDFSNKMKSGLATAGKVGAAAIGAASTALGVLGKIGLDYNSQMETYTTNFGVMLGSTEAAVGKVEELKTMAEKTPFGMSDLADATQTLLSFQVPAEETTGILKQLGDISLGNSQKLSGLSLVFGQVSSAGKLTGQDLMQFINQGFNPLNYIAERTGESMEELRDRMSKGAIGVDEIKNAFIDATSEGGQFFNGMEEGSKTTEGMMSTLSDTIHSKLGEAFQSVSNKLKDELLPKAIEFVESIDVEKVVSSIQGLADAFMKLVPVIAGGSAAMVAFKVASAISGALSMLSESIAVAGGAFKALGVIISANPIGLISAAIAGIVVAIMALWATNEDFRNAVTEIWEGIKDAFVGAWESIKNAWSETKYFFSGIWEGIKGMFSDAWEAFKEIGANIVSGIWEGIKSGAAWLTDKVGGFFTDIVDGVKDALGIRSPSRVFADIGKNMALGVGDGWSNEFDSIKRGISGNMDFGTATIDVQRSFSNGFASRTAQSGSAQSANEIVIPITIPVDGAILAKKLFRYNVREGVLVGDSLVKVGG